MRDQKSTYLRSGKRQIYANLIWQMKYHRFRPNHPLYNNHLKNTKNNISMLFKNNYLWKLCDLYSNSGKKMTRGKILSSQLELVEKFSHKQDANCHKTCKMKYMPQPRGQGSLRAIWKWIIFSTEEPLLLRSYFGLCPKSWCPHVSTFKINIEWNFN